MANPPLPAVLLTGFLFLSLLRFGATQKSIQRQTRNRKNRSQIAVETKCDQSEISFSAASESVSEVSEGGASCSCLGATQRSIQRQTRNRKNPSQIAVEIQCEKSESFAAVSEGSEAAVLCACFNATQSSILRQIKNRKNRSQIAVESESKQSDSSAAVSEVVTEGSEIAVSCATQRSILHQTKNRKKRSQIAVAIKSKQLEISSAAVSEVVTEGSEVAVPYACLNATQSSILRQIKNRKNRSQIAVEIKSKQSENSAAASEAVSDGSDGGASNACYNKLFIQWNVRAPLEVIHEEYENEASNESDEPESRLERVGLDRYPSLSMYYPETDSDSSSDGIWRESMDDNVCFMWDEDEDRDEMIEISLEKMNKKVLGFELELEDNLIEIDISPMRNAGEFPDECLGSVNAR